VARAVAVVLVVGGVVVGAAQSRAAGPDTGPDTGPEPTIAAIGQPTNRLGCAIQGPLPEQACTPGAVFESVTVEQVCTPGYARGVRTVATSTKTEVDAGRMPHQEAHRRIAGTWLGAGRRPGGPNDGCAVAAVRAATVRRRAR
jgi:hypothetical protein